MYGKNINIIYHSGMNFYHLKISVKFCRYLKCTIFFESKMVLMRVYNLKTTINNKVCIRKYVLVLDPAK